MFFTAAPQTVRALQDIDIDYLKDGNRYKKFIPQLYYYGQERELFNKKTWIFSQARGIVQSTVIFFVMLNCFHVGHISGSDGHNADMWLMTLVMNTCAVVVPNVKCLI